MKALICVQKVRAGSGDNFVLEGGLWESLILGCRRGGEGPALTLGVGVQTWSSEYVFGVVASGVRLVLPIMGTAASSLGGCSLSDVL